MSVEVGDGADLDRRDRGYLAGEVLGEEEVVVPHRGGCTLLGANPEEDGSIHPHGPHVAIEVRGRMPGIDGVALAVLARPVALEQTQAGNHAQLRVVSIFGERAPSRIAAFVRLEIGVGDPGGGTLLQVFWFVELLKVDARIGGPIRELGDGAGVTSDQVKRD